MNDTNTKILTIDASATLSKLNAFEGAIATIRQHYNARGELIEQQQQTIADLRAQLDKCQAGDDDDASKPDSHSLYVAHYNVEPDNAALLDDLNIVPAYTIHMHELVAGTDDNGWIVLIDEVAFLERVRAMIPADYTGPVWFDIEGKLEQAADAGNQDAIDRMLEILSRGKLARPAAKWGIYNFPRGQWYPIDEEQLRERVRVGTQNVIAQACDVWSPARYEMLWGETWTSDWTVEANRINMQVMRKEAHGRPLIPFVMHRYAENAKWLHGLGGTLVHPARFASTIRTLRDHGADGVILWGTDDTIVRNYALRAFLGTWPSPTDTTYYLPISRARSVVAHERKPQYTIDEHVSMVNRYYLQALAAAWDGDELPSPPDVNFGPVDTVLPPAVNFAFAHPHKPGIMTGEHSEITLDHASDVLVRDVAIENGSRWALKVNNGQHADRVAVRNLRGSGLTEYCIYLGGARNWTFAGIDLDRADNAKEHGLRIAGGENIVVAQHENGTRNYLGGASKSIVWIVGCNNLHFECVDLGRAEKPVGAIRLGARPDIVDANSATLRHGDRQGGVIRDDGQWIQPPPKSTNLTLRDIRHWHNGNDNHALCVWPGPESFVIEDYHVWTKAGRAIHFDSRWSGRAVLRNIKINGEPLDWKHIDTGGRPLDELQARVTIEHSPAEVVEGQQ